MVFGLYKINVGEDLPSTYQCSVNYGGSVGVSKEMNVNAIINSEGKENNRPLVYHHGNYLEMIENMQTVGYQNR